MLKTRIFLGSVMILVVLAVLGFEARLAPYYPCFLLAIGTVVWIAAQELAHLLRQYPLPVQPWFCSTGSVLIIAGNWLPHLDSTSTRGPSVRFALLVFVGVGMAAFLLAIWKYSHPGSSLLALLGHLLVFFYVGVLGSFVVQLRWFGDRPAEGAMAFLLVVFVAKFCDIGAYFTGCWIGRTKLAPVLSPGKTVEGALGGFLCAVALAIGMVFVGEWMTGKDFGRLTFGVLFGSILGITAQFGDLVESLIKRDCKQKDASGNVPGFGGLLDVIDSVLFCGPVAYLLLAWL